mgnify:CR=1 FL=1
MNISNCKTVDDLFVSVKTTRTNGLNETEQEIIASIAEYYPNLLLDVLLSGSNINSKYDLLLVNEINKFICNLKNIPDPWKRILEIYRSRDHG